MWYTRGVGLIAVGMLAAACAAGLGVEPGVPLTGPWGGRSVSLSLSESGGTVEYDCAHGVIAAPLSPDDDGAVRAPGVHIREHGGPVRDGEPLDSVPALYFGSVRAGTLTLRVVVGADTLGAFVAVRGAAPQLFKCL
jgi:hypothetical protein